VWRLGKVHLYRLLSLIFKVAKQNLLKLPLIMAHRQRCALDVSLVANSSAGAHDDYSDASACERVDIYGVGSSSARTKYCFAVGTRIDHAE
jgi:hypothetical protein